MSGHPRKSQPALLFEHKSQPLLSRRAFIGRLALSMLWALGLVAVSLAIGMIGYHALESLDWLDAFLNAAMLLGGMGPLDAPKTPGGKLFAGLYALYSGLVFIVTAAVLFAPLLHRVLHRFHVDEKS